MLTYEKKIAFLRSAAVLKRELNAAIEEAKELESLAGSVSAVCMGDEVRSSDRGSSGIESTIEGLVEIRNKVLKLSHRYAEQYRKVEKVVLLIPDDRDRMIFRLKYLLGLTWDRVADNVDLSERRVRQIHHDVVENLKLPDNPTDSVNGGD